MTAEDREIARTAPAWWTGADVSQTELPPLPEPRIQIDGDEDVVYGPADYYSDDQMRDYARTALAAERVRADAAERDARRYRFLRQHNDGFNWQVLNRGMPGHGLIQIGNPDNYYLDAAIDAAITQEARDA